MIIGVLTGLAVPRYITSRKQLASVFCSNITALGKLLEEYRTVHMSYPSSLAILRNEFTVLPQNPYTKYPMLDNTVNSGIVYVTTGNDYVVFVTQTDENGDVISCNLHNVLSGKPFFLVYNLIMAENITSTQSVQFPVIYEG